MERQLRSALEAELARARSEEQAGELAAAWRHLERAHVLSQRHAGPHVRVHARMLGYGLRRRDAREIWGQLVRIFVAAPGTWLGRAPRGNSGGAGVGILEPMAIPEDLQAVLEPTAAKETRD
jgi:hypothetical protein